MRFFLILSCCDPAQHCPLAERADELGGCGCSGRRHFTDSAMELAEMEQQLAPDDEALMVLQGQVSSGKSGVQARESRHSLEPAAVTGGEPR